MPMPLELELTEQRHWEQRWHRDHDAKPYVRRRYESFLMIANGDCARIVAWQHLYRSRNADPRLSEAVWKKTKTMLELL